MAPRTGRPTDDPKKNHYLLRMTDSDVEKLEYCSQATGKTKAEIIREGIDKVYQELQNK